MPIRPEDFCHIFIGLTEMPLAQFLSSTNSEVAAALVSIGMKSYWKHDQLADGLTES